MQWPLVWRSTFTDLADKCHDNINDLRRRTKAFNAALETNRTRPILVTLPFPMGLTVTKRNTISKIKDDGAASENAKIRVGMKIRAVNGVQILNNGQALVELKRVWKQGPNSATLALQRGEPGAI